MKLLPILPLLFALATFGGLTTVYVLTACGGHHEAACDANPGANGGTCTDDAACSSGFCRDGVCCNAACVGGELDCQACSIASGGQVDGVCTTIIAPGHACRPSADAFCDLVETCDGVSNACPPDLGQHNDYNCAEGVACPWNGPEGSPHVCPAS